MGSETKLSDLDISDIQIKRLAFQFNELYHREKRNNLKVDFKILFKNFYSTLTFVDKENKQAYGFLMGKIGCLTREIDQRRKQRDHLRRKREEKRLEWELIKKEFSFGEKPPKEGSTAFLTWQIQNNLVSADNYY